MAYADQIRSATCTMSDVATLIEGVFVSGYPLTWSTWTPTLSASGAMTISATVVNYAKYIQVGKLVIFATRCTFTTGGTQDKEVIFSLPVTAAAANNIAFAAQVVDTSAIPTAASSYQYNTTSGSVLRYDSANWGLGVSRQIRVIGFYEAA